MRMKHYTVELGVLAITWDELRSLKHTALEPNIGFESRELSVEEKKIYSHNSNTNGEAELWIIKLSSLGGERNNRYITCDDVCKVADLLKGKYKENFIPGSDVTEATKWRTPRLGELELRAIYARNEIVLGYPIDNSDKFYPFKDKIFEETGLVFDLSPRFPVAKQKLIATSASGRFTRIQISKALELCQQIYSSKFIPDDSLFEYQHLSDEVKLSRWASGPVGGILHNGTVRRLYKTEEPNTLWIGEGLGYPSKLVLSETPGNLQHKLLPNTIDHALLSKSYGDDIRGVVYSRDVTVVLVSTTVAEIRAKNQANQRTNKIIYVRIN